MVRLSGDAICFLGPTRAAKHSRVILQRRDRRLTCWAASVFVDTQGAVHHGREVLDSAFSALRWHAGRQSWHPQPCPPICKPAPTFRSAALDPLHYLVGVGPGGGRRSISVETAIERAPFLPTERTAKK